MRFAYFHIVVIFSPISPELEKKRNEENGDNLLCTYAAEAICTYKGKTDLCVTVYASTTTAEAALPFPVPKAYVTVVVRV